MSFSEAADHPPATVGCPRFQSLHVEIIDTLIDPRAYVFDSNDLARVLLEDSTTYWGHDMLNSKRGLLGALGLVAMAAGLPAWAAPVSAGTPVVFNFAGPLGPFTSLSIDFGIVRCTVFEDEVASGCLGVASPDNGTITSFDGLDGSGASTPRGRWNDGVASSFTRGPIASFPFAEDGQFSLRYDASIGAIEAFPFAIWTDARGSQTRIDGVVAAAAVPETGTLALIMAGVAAVAIARRRRVA